MNQEYGAGRATGQATTAMSQLKEVKEPNEQQMLTEFTQISINDML